MGRRLALLIATYQYQDPELRQLTAPAHDADALAAVLRDPDIAGFEVTMLVNKPHHRVGQAIGEFYRDPRRDDLTLLYFTGHGLKDDHGRLYLAMVNTRRDSLLFTALSAEHIDQAMEGCASRQKVLILDCCYSGAYPSGWLPKSDAQVHALERFQGWGRTVLTASDATQYSFEGDRRHGYAPQSVFTRHLIAGLRDGSADLDGDGDITLDELYSYVYDRVVAERPQQRPKKQDNVQGRTVIARNINWSLPSYLRNAISSPMATDRLAALDGLAHLYRIGNDMVRRAVVDEIQHLADDDSRRVSAAAVARLESLPHRPPGPQPVPPRQVLDDSSPPAEPSAEETEPAAAQAVSDIADDQPPTQPTGADTMPTQPPSQDVAIQRPGDDHGSVVPAAAVEFVPDQLPEAASPQQLLDDSSPPAAPPAEPSAEETEPAAAQAVSDIADDQPPTQPTGADTMPTQPPSQDVAIQRPGDDHGSVVPAAAVEFVPDQLPEAASPQQLLDDSSPPAAPPAEPSAEETEPAAAQAVSDIADDQPPTQPSGADTMPTQPPSEGVTGIQAEPLIAAQPLTVDEEIERQSAGPATGVKQPSGMDHRRQRRPRPARLSRAGGLIASLAAGLFIVGGLYDGFRSVHLASPAWYYVGMAAVAMTACVCMLAPKTRSLVGPGIVLGGVAASTWGLVIVGGSLAVSPAYVRDVAVWLAVAAHLCLMISAVVAVVALLRTGVVRIEFRMPRQGVARIAVALGAVAALVGGVTLAAQARHSDQLGDQLIGVLSGLLASEARAYDVAAIMALNVPVWAAVVAPRRLGLSLIAGWIGGSWAICLVTRTWNPDSIGQAICFAPGPGVGGEKDVTVAILFGGTLLLLMFSAAMVARLSPESQHQPPNSVVGRTEQAAARDSGPAASPRPPRQRRMVVLFSRLTIVILLSAAGVLAIDHVARATSETRTEAQNLAVSPDGHRVYVTSWLVPAKTCSGSTKSSIPGHVWVIDATANTPVGSPIVVGDRASGVEVSPDGRHLYVSNFGAGTMSVIDTSRNVAVGSPIPVGASPVRAGVSIDGRRVYVRSRHTQTVSAIDAETNKVVGSPIPLGQDTGPLTYSPDGRRIYATNGNLASGPYHLSIIDTETGKTIGSPVPLSEKDNPTFLLASSDGSRVYIATETGNVDFSARPSPSGKLWTLDTKTSKFLGSPVVLDSKVVYSLNTRAAMDISPDGTRIYRAYTDTSTLFVIDTKSNALVETPIKLSKSPGAMVVSPDGRRLYITNFLDNSISVIRTDDSSEVSVIHLESK